MFSRLSSFFYRAGSLSRDLSDVQSGHFPRRLLSRWAHRGVDRLINRL